MEDNFDLEYPFLLTKLDTTNGFWRLVVSHLQACNLFYVFPSSNDQTVSLDKAEIVVPTELQMG